MWIRIRAVIVEDEPLAGKYLAMLLDDTCQVEVIATAADSEAGLRLCAELRPDAVFLDINLPGKTAFVGDATDYASTAATLGLHYGIAQPCRRRLPDGYGRLSAKAVGSRAGRKGGQNRLLAYLAAWIS